MSETTPIEKAICKFCEKGEQPDPRDFFLAWNIPAPIIAERLRGTGLKDVKAEQIKRILENGIYKQEERYLLIIAMYEMRNDITRTLYEK